jgi:AraC-like DNA-binding protein
VVAGTYPFEIAAESVTGWHYHDLHQLEYAFQGIAEVETADARYLLPPQQAAWIPAGTEHCTTLTRTRTLAVFFDPAFFAAQRPRPAGGDRVRSLAEVTLADVCASVAVSERTLRRAFEARAGMSWRQYLLQARLLRAMALLSQPGPTVLAIASQVGFESLSGFTRAFRRLTGETPMAYRQRVAV